MIMKIASPAFLALLLLGVTTRGLQAQDRVDMLDVGLSVALPDSWSEIKTWDVNEQSPEFAFYHVQDNESGKFVALRREACQADEKKELWATGELAAGGLGPEDTLTPLPEDALITFNEHAGYVIVAPRGSYAYTSYNFTWIEGDYCYRAQLGAPGDAFAASSGEFQQIVDSIRPID